MMRDDDQRPIFSILLGSGSVAFCHGIGLNYATCSPSRVPIARLAAAQANFKDGGSNRDR